jgi:hypothetical protein
VLISISTTASFSLPWPRKRLGRRNSRRRLDPNLQITPERDDWIHLPRQNSTSTWLISSSRMTRYVHLLLLRVLHAYYC